MSDLPAARATRGADKSAAPAEKRPLLKKLLDLVARGPDSRDQLMEQLADAEHKELIEPESRMMLEGVIRMADMTAGDVMVPSRHMDLLDIEAPYEEMLHVIIHTGHSRFPVFEERRDNIIGVLMAKDLLKLQRSPTLSLRTLLRPAFFVPESKGLNELLRDFRTNRNHIALVVDEFGHNAGLLTLEDVLEEIVGEIEDEFDEREGADTSVYTLADGSQRVAGDATVAAVNEAFDVALPTEEFDTIGGLVAHELGRVPRRGESLAIGGLVFAVMLARGGAVRWFKVTRAAEEALGSDGA
jgi:magnesium and cobalt transporter